MRMLLLTGAAVAALTSSASAQAVDWSGSYIGIHGGYALSAPGVTGDIDLDGSGFLAGVYLGHDWQDGGLVYGLMGEFDYLAIDNQNVADSFLGKSDDYNYDVDWLASVRGRMGSAFSDNVLVTGSFGVAAADISASLGSVGEVNDSFDAMSGVVFGTVIGLGAEYQFAPNWTMKADYSYYLFQSIDLQSVNGDSEIKPKFGVVRLGVAYRF